MLGDATVTNDTGAYAFGYCDVHPKSNTAGNYNKAYNPYAVTAAELASGTTWNNYLNPTSGSKTGGGDPIDLAWAVYPAKYDTNYKNANDQIVEVAGTTHPNAGEPVSFASSPIRFVRIYTGAAKMNGINGEISTEVCGVYVASGTGSGNASILPQVTFGRTTSSMSSVSVSALTSTPVSFSLGTKCYVNVTCNADYIYVNGVQVTSGTNIEFTVPVGTTKQVQIITQEGTESPFVTMLSISR